MFLSVLRTFSVQIGDDFPSKNPNNVEGDEALCLHLSPVIDFLLFGSFDPGMDAFNLFFGHLAIALDLFYVKKLFVLLSLVDSFIPCPA